MECNRIISTINISSTDSLGQIAMPLAWRAQLGHFRFDYVEEHMICATRARVDKSVHSDLDPESRCLKYEMTLPMLH